MSTEIRGADELRSKLEQLGPNALREGGRALYQEALVIQKVSMERTPVAPDGGTLRASHVTTRPEAIDGIVSVRIEVGGPSAPYAMAVHEHLSEHSPASWKAAEAAGRPVQWNVGGPKFLESAVAEAMPEFAERLIRRIDLNQLAKEAK